MSSFQIYHEEEDKFYTVTVNVESKVNMQQTTGNLV
jgi:hypothetical protein